MFFEKDYRINKNEILESVYKKPMPNRFLANFTNFLVDKNQRELCPSEPDIKLRKKTTERLDSIRFSMYAIQGLSILFHFFLNRMDFPIEKFEDSFNKNNH